MNNLSIKQMKQMKQILDIYSMVMPQFSYTLSNETDFAITINLKLISKYRIYETELNLTSVISKYIFNIILREAICTKLIGDIIEKEII